MVQTSSVTHSASSRTIVGLDLIRFLCAALVVVYHLAHRAWAPAVEKASIRQLFPSTPAFPDLEPVAWIGWIGVEIFFVISGFVIAGSAERSSAFGFLRSRTLRLAPAITICATLTLGVLLLEQRFDAMALLKDYVRTLALMLFPKGPWIDSVYWTLVAEIVFYSAVFCLIALNRVSHLSAFAISLGVASSAIWIGCALFGVGDHFLGTWQAKVSLVRYGCLFATGMLLWMAFFKPPSLLRWGVLTACILAAVLEIDYRTMEVANATGRAFSPVVPQALFLLTVLAIALSVRFNDRLVAMLRGRTSLIVTLGLMTYPLYLIHNVIGVWLINTLARTGFKAHAALLFSACAMILLSWMICRRAEPALARLLRAALDRLGAVAQRYTYLAWLFGGPTASPQKVRSER